MPGERRRRAGCVLLVALACAVGLAVSAGEEPHGTAPLAGAQTFVYRCPDGGVFVVRVQGDVARILMPSSTLKLSRVRSASGEKFEHGESLYWSEGEEAMLDIAGDTHRGCRNDRRRAIWEDARIRGVDFRATGNEPGWILEITEDAEIRYVGDYGQVTLEMQAQPEQSTAEQATRYSATDGSHRLSLLIERERCDDSMSGEEFPARVSLTLDGRTLRGCGRPLN